MTLYTDVALEPEDEDDDLERGFDDDDLAGFDIHRDDEDGDLLGEATTDDNDDGYYYNDDDSM